MLGADILLKLERHLDDQNGKDRAVIDELNDALEAIYGLPDYQRWLNEPHQYAPQYILPSTFGVQLTSATKRLLNRYWIVNGGYIEVRIDKHGKRIHVTDGGWVPTDIRVYPYSDESQVLCEYVERKSLHVGVDLLVDPACGCGHHGLALSEMIPVQINLDINIRALAFCRINSILSNSEQTLSGLNDIREGFPAFFNMLRSDSALIVVNMPFGIFPSQRSLTRTLAQNGGDRGVALTFKTLEAVEKLSRSASGIKHLRMVMLFYSLGVKKSGAWRWEVEDKARRTFPDAKISVQILEGEKMWRVDGVKTEANPMVLNRMERKAYCTETFTKGEMDGVARDYRELASLFEMSGYSHLGYGILDVEVR